MNDMPLGLTQSVSQVQMPLSPIFSPRSVACSSLLRPRPPARPVLPPAPAPDRTELELSAALRPISCARP
jgi:hypothetical protein